MKNNLLLVALLLAAANLFGQHGLNTMPHIVHQNGRHALMVDGKPFFMFGGQAHNSSAWPAMMPGVWLAASKLHLNTLELPIYWEQVEPQSGKFDFSLVDTLLEQARAHQVRLVLLWFATWKNGSNHYMPEWMKRDAIKYPNIIGQKGDWADSPSPHAGATLEADKKAFSAVMRYLKKADPQHTVIMVQVENEPGAWGSVRDYSPAAQQLFEGPVPAALLEPGILNQLPHEATKGSWREVFGKNADEYFHAWSVATYIEMVAAAGKEEYDLPLYVNAALKETIDLGNWQARLTFGGPGWGNDLPANAPAVGKMMIVQLADDKFIAIGTHARITFKPMRKNAGKPWQYLKVEEGYFEKGVFKPMRILNGDETDWCGPYFGSAPQVLQITLVTR